MYLTVKNRAISEFEEKKSIFIGNIKRVYTEEEAKEFINKIKSENKEARHNVYAYIIGQNMGIQRYSDDGEPQGTGGIPILEVIKKNGITDVVVVVTRYFGGILLGTGGLTRAYSKGAASAIKNAGIVEKVKGVPIYITVDYDLLGKLQYYMTQNSWHIENIEYTDKVKIEILCEVIKSIEFINNINEITAGNCKIEKMEEKMYFKQEKRLLEE